MIKKMYNFSLHHSHESTNTNRIGLSDVRDVWDVVVSVKKMWHKPSQRYIIKR